MTGDPMEYGVGENQIDRRVRRPSGDVGIDEMRVREAPARRREHVRRVVDAYDPCLGKAGRDKLCRVSGTAPKINNGGSAG